MTRLSDEIDRIREAYDRRARTGADERYSLDDPANLFLFQRRERALLELLARRGIMPLQGKRMLDIGCGNGAVLRDFVRYGAQPELLCGIDLLPERIAAARAQSAQVTEFSLGAATDLPYPAGQFDIALMFTVLSSIVDQRARRSVAAEAMRILRPSGTLIVYDFTWNPRNRDVRGVGLGDLRALFPTCTVDAQRVTLAPPITRRIARVSWPLASALEALPFLRSHVLAAVWQPS